VILISSHSVGDDIKSHIAELLKDNILRNKRASRKFICAFTEYHEDLARLRFDKMILKFVYYPILGIAHDAN
jgi:hypothetical protein